MSKFFLLFVLTVSFFWWLLPQVVYVVGWLVGLVFRQHLAWRPFAWAGVCLLALWWMVFAYGNRVGRFRWEVKAVNYENAMLPTAFDGYRLVQISDLHLDGWTGRRDRLSRLVEEINALEPDLIAFTGDLVSFNYHELEPFVDILASLRAKDGVVSILGNHDYDPYERGLTSSERQQRIDSLVAMQRTALGWRLLLNENCIIRRGTDSVAVLGVENQSCGAHNIIRRGRLSQAMAGTENGTFRILLSHDPTHWRAEVVGQTDIPLTLSGHTHAMQFRLFGFTPSRWIYPECDGRYDAGAQTLYVNIGLGGTLPMRIGATPEITLLTLRHGHSK